MTAVVYDTSVVIDPTGLGSWAAESPLISAVTLAELATGTDVGDALERASRRRRLTYIAATYQVVPFGVAQAEAYGVLVTLIREAGRAHRGRALDLQIAATAAVAGVPLLTRNPGDFEGIERAVRVVAIG